MSPIAAYSKDPADRRDYSLDWAALGLLPAGDSISASTWTADAGITVESAGQFAPTFTTTKTTVWLSGGTDGTSYNVTNRITTTAGRIVERTIKVLVANQ